MKQKMSVCRTKGGIVEGWEIEVAIDLRQGRRYQCNGWRRKKAEMLVRTARKGMKMNLNCKWSVSKTIFSFLINQMKDGVIIVASKLGILTKYAVHHYSDHSLSLPHSLKLDMAFNTIGFCLILLQLMESIIESSSFELTTTAHEGSEEIEPSPNPNLSRKNKL